MKSCIALVLANVEINKQSTVGGLHCVKVGLHGFAVSLLPLVRTQNISLDTL
jgi:hypothetical protein